MHTLWDYVLHYEKVSSFFFSRSTLQKNPNCHFKLHTLARSGILLKSDGIHPPYQKKSLGNIPRGILLLITLLMLSGIVIPYAHAADSLIVDFNAMPISGIKPLDVQFSDATIAADPANNTYLWTFGDGSSSTEINPPHTYLSSGTYTVNLTVTEITGNNTTLSKPYYIHVADTLNATDFSGIPQCGLSPLPVQFIDQVTLPHDQWEWNFGDGGTSNLSDPQYTYNGQGSWTVSLYIWNNSGGPQSIISKTDYIRVIPQGIASFSAAGTGNANPLMIQFNDTSTGFIPPVTYSWDFGDSGKSTDQNPLHTYPNLSGSYPITFKVADNCGQVITENGSIIVSEGSVIFLAQLGTGVPGAPVADFTGIPTSGAAPLDVTFSDTSLNNPTSWNWSFGDGEYSAISNPVHTYTSNGNYTVSLTATNSMGSSTKTRIEYVTVPGFLLAPPTERSVNFTGTPIFGTTPLTVQFTDTSVGFKESPTYLWDFGDGSISTVRNASHVYTITGLHSVSLTITGIDGYSETLVKTNYINTELPSIEFVLGMDEGTSIQSPNSTLPTQTFPQSESYPISKSGLSAHSLQTAKSISSGLSAYQDQSLSKDISQQNVLSADNIVKKNVEILNWSMHSGDNEMGNAFWMQITTPDPWRVEVYDSDAEIAAKPIGAEGRMAEYYTNGYIHDGEFLTHPFRLQSSGSTNEISLSGQHQEIQSSPGGAPGQERFYITLRQRVESSDRMLNVDERYRIVITFEAFNY